MGVEPRELDELIAAVDVISLNCPLTPDNRHMLDATRLGSMRDGAWVINTARGPLIDEAALVGALRSGRIGAAALDVFEVEPLPADSPLRQMDQVILGAHNASNTVEAVRRVNEMAIANLLEGLEEAPVRGGSS